jgi:hypothetical protein
MIYALIFLLTAIGSFLGSYLWVKKITYTADNQLDCMTKALPVKDGGDCAIWDNGTCRKGTITNGQCVSKASPGPMILLILGSVSILVSIYFFIMAFKAPSLSA